MKYIVEESLEQFQAWSGGKATLDLLIAKGDVERVEEILSKNLGKLPTDVEINDFLWFYRDEIAEYLGYLDWEHYLAPYNNGEV